MVHSVFYHVAALAKNYNLVGYGAVLEHCYFGENEDGNVPKPWVAIIIDDNLYGLEPKKQNKTKQKAKKKKKKKKKMFPTGVQNNMQQVYVGWSMHNLESHWPSIIQDDRGCRTYLYGGKCDPDLAKKIRKSGLHFDPICIP